MIRRAAWFAGAPVRAAGDRADPPVSRHALRLAGRPMPLLPHVLALRRGRDPRARSAPGNRDGRLAHPAMQSVRQGRDRPRPRPASGMTTSHTALMDPRPTGRRSDAGARHLPGTAERDRLGAGVDLRPRRQLRAVHHPAHHRHQGGAAASRREADQVDAGDAVHPAEGQGAAEEVQGQQDQGPRRDDEALQGGRGEPARRMPPAPPAVPHPDRDVRGDPGSPAPADTEVVDGDADGVPRSTTATSRSTASCSRTC